jgi:hypothetical protein
MQRYKNGYSARKHVKSDESGTGGSMLLWISSTYVGLSSTRSRSTHFLHFDNIPSSSLTG